MDQKKKLIKSELFNLNFVLINLALSPQVKDINNQKKM